MTPTSILLQYQSADYVNIDLNFWSTTGTVNGGASSQGSGCLSLATGATANGSALLTSSRMARYINGTSNIWSAMVSLPSGAAPDPNNISRWGMVGGLGSACRFEMNNGTLQVATAANSVVTVVPQASWNGPGAAGFVMDGSYHYYEIAYGVSGFEFSIDGAVMHTVAATPLATWSLDMLPTFQCGNFGGGATPTTLNVRGMAIGRMGPESTAEKTYYHSTTNATTVLKTGSGFLKSVVINKKGAAGATATLWDSPAAAGTQIASIDLTTLRQIDYNCVFKNGLTLVTAGNTGGDFTLIFD